MPNTPDPYADALTRLNAQRQVAVADYVRHARNPSHSGADVAHLKHWAQWYEASAMLAEQNPAVAVTLLPLLGGPALPNALPLVPTGIHWQVDAPGSPGTVAVTLDVQGAVSVSVFQPTTPAVLHPTVSTTGTRVTFAFPAAIDGLYRVALRVGLTVLAYFLVPVTRTEFRLLREDSRYLRFQFRQAAPRPGAVYVGRLARLGTAEAAAVTNQPLLANALLASARALPVAPTPTALYPSRSC